MSQLILNVVVGNKTRTLSIHSDSQLSFRPENKHVLANRGHVFTVEEDGVRPNRMCSLYPERETVIRMARRNSPVSLGFYTLPPDPALEVVEVYIDEPIDGCFEVTVDEKRKPRLSWWPPAWLSRLPWKTQSR